MPKRDPLRTPNSKIKAALRQLMLRSREQQYALKRDDRRCRVCDVKASQARGRVVKVECHHVDGVKWKEIIEYIRAQLLVHPDKLMTLCKEHHDEVEEKRKKRENKAEIQKRREDAFCEKCVYPCEQPCPSLELFRRTGK